MGDKNSVEVRDSEYNEELVVESASDSGEMHRNNALRGLDSTTEDLSKGADWEVPESDSEEMRLNMAGRDGKVDKERMDDQSMVEVRDTHGGGETTVLDSGEKSGTDVLSNLEGSESDAVGTQQNYVLGLVNSWSANLQSRIRDGVDFIRQERWWEQVQRGRMVLGVDRMLVVMTGVATLGLGAVIWGVFILIGYQKEATPQFDSRVRLAPRVASVDVGKESEVEVVMNVDAAVKQIKLAFMYDAEVITISDLQVEKSFEENGWFVPVLEQWEEGDQGTLGISAIRKDSNQLGMREVVIARVRIRGDVQGSTAVTLNSSESWVMGDGFEENLRLYEPVAYTVDGSDELAEILNEKRTEEELEEIRLQATAEADLNEDGTVAELGGPSRGDVKGTSKVAGSVLFKGGYGGLVVGKPVSSE